MRSSQLDRYKPGRLRLSALALSAMLIVAACGGSAASPNPAVPAIFAGRSPVAATATPTATSVPTPSPNLTPALAAAPCLAGSAEGPFLSRSGTQITCAGHAVLLTGYTFYPALLGGSKAWHRPDFKTYIDHVLDMGAAAGQNLIRPTDQWDKHTAGQTADDPVVWANMDYLLQAARNRGMFVVIDLSAYRWLLMSHGSDPTKASAWNTFITGVAARYRDNPAVAFYSIAGEPTPPRTAAEMQTLVAFYRSTTEALRAADPNHLITAGGFNHMEDEPPGVDWWQAIDALPDNDIVGVKTYSQKDLDLMPAIAEYGTSVNRPVVDEEFGMPQGFGDASFAGRSAYNGLATGRAPFFRDVYTIGKSLGFSGFVVWNMGCEMGTGSYEVSPLTPSAWSAVKDNGAIATPEGVGETVPLCS